MVVHWHRTGGDLACSADLVGHEAEQALPRPLRALQRVRGGRGVVRVDSKLMLDGDTLSVEGQLVVVIGRGFKFAGAYVTNVEIVANE